MTHRVVLIGNTSVPTSTETFLARAFREIGCDVVEVTQEHAYNMGADAFSSMLLTGPLSKPRPDLVLYTRTHNHTALGPTWTDGWQRLGKAGIITASIHLDRFWDLERENLIPADPLFTVQHCFTADGGNDERWLAARINHHWMLPAVDRTEAEMPGTPTNGVPDIIFVGSGGRSYHRQYPERGALLDHLNTTYGRRFGHYGHGGNRPPVRGQALNDVYASARIVVGDSCFANQPGSGGLVNPDDPTSPEIVDRSNRYWSDRIPETLGRGGFLLHPWVPGLRAVYGGCLATYNPGDWDDLDAQIGAYLANPGDRQTMIETGRSLVLARHTYTNRAAEVLMKVGLTVPAPA